MAHYLNGSTGPMHNTLFPVNNNNLLMPLTQDLSSPLLCPSNRPEVVVHHLHGTTYYHYAMPIEQVSLDHSMRPDVLPPGVTSFQRNGTTYFQYSAKISGQGQDTKQSSTLSSPTILSQAKSSDATSPPKLPKGVISYTRKGCTFFQYQQESTDASKPLQHTSSPSGMVAVTQSTPESTEVVMTETPIYVLEAEQEQTSPEQAADEAFNNQEQLMRMYPSTHHFNWWSSPMLGKTFTAATVSLVALVTEPKTLMYGVPEFGLSEWVRLRQAFALVDPVIYWGPPEVLYNLKGTKLQEAATGFVRKFYSGFGSWSGDYNEASEEIPLHDGMTVCSYEPADFIFNGWFGNNNVWVRKDHEEACERAYNESLSAINSAASGRREKPVGKSPLSMVIVVAAEVNEVEISTLIPPSERPLVPAPLNVRKASAESASESTFGSDSDLEAIEVFSNGSGSHDTSSKTSPTVETVEEAISGNLLRDVVKSVEDHVYEVNKAEYGSVEEYYDRFDEEAYDADMEIPVAAEVLSPSVLRDTMLGFGDQFTPTEEDIDIGNSISSAESFSPIPLPSFELVLPPIEMMTEMEEAGDSVPQPLFVQLVSEENLEAASEESEAESEAPQASHRGPPPIQPATPKSGHSSSSKSQRRSRLPVCRPSPIPCALNPGKGPLSSFNRGMPVLENVPSNPFATLKDISSRPKTIFIDLHSGLTPDGSKLPMPVQKSAPKPRYSEFCGESPRILGLEEQKEESIGENYLQIKPNHVDSSEKADALAYIADHFSRSVSTKKTSCELGRLRPRKFLTRSEENTDLKRLTDFEEDDEPVTPESKQRVFHVTSSPDPRAGKKVAFDEQPTWHLFDDRSDYSGASAAVYPKQKSPSRFDDSDESDSDESLDDIVVHSPALKSTVPPVLESTASPVSEPMSLPLFEKTRSPESGSIPYWDPANGQVVHPPQAEFFQWVERFVPARAQSDQSQQAEEQKEHEQQEREEWEQYERSEDIKTLMTPLTNFEPSIPALESFGSLPFSPHVSISPPAVILEPVGPLPTFKRTRMGLRHTSWSSITNKLHKKQLAVTQQVDMEQEVRPKKGVFGSMKNFFGSLRSRRN